MVFVSYAGWGKPQLAPVESMRVVREIITPVKVIGGMVFHSSQVE
jgi:hypothetical protein